VTEIRIGRYRLFHRIGSGGMASVYLGRLSGEKGFARLVAVKRLHPHCASDPKLVEGLVREARIVSRIRHPNVVAVLDVLTEGEESCLVLEYVHGETLHRLVQESVAQARRVDPAIIARIAIDVLEGLHAAHEARDEAGNPLHVVHRDVSPHNVIIDSSGSARLVDFGIAKVLARPQTTQTGQLKGKLSYMPPEQIDGRDVGRLADIWAVGVIVWELITLERLFEADTAAQVIFKVLSGEIPGPSSVAPCDPTLESVVMRCLERDPTRRFATARDAAIGIESAVRPASSRDVSEWLRELAGPSLKQRESWLKEVESAPEGAHRRASASGPSWRTAILGATVTACVSAGLVAVASFGRPVGSRPANVDVTATATTTGASDAPSPVDSSRDEPSTMTNGDPPRTAELDGGSLTLAAGPRSRPRSARPPQHLAVPVPSSSAGPTASGPAMPSASGDALRLHERR
jgi:eukaryotic-like serine/threonine-protein kinase